MLCDQLSLLTPRHAVVQDLSEALDQDAVILSFF
jgi:hypothetical protein